MKTALKRAIYTAGGSFNVSTPVIAGATNVEILIYGVSCNASGPVTVSVNGTAVPLYYAPASSAVMFDNPILVPVGQGVNVSADDIIIYYTTRNTASVAG
tara:strand:+ start:613 stop:912 length:300 start_codon:yes stop_codon:yes gene_type:complete